MARSNDGPLDDESILATLELGDEIARIRIAAEGDVVELCDLLHTSFADRPPVQPPAAALSETPETLFAAMSRGFGVVVENDRRIIAGLIVDQTQDPAVIGRVAVAPDHQRQGIAQALVEVTLVEMANRGIAHTLVHARKEFPKIAHWWESRGFVSNGETGTTITLVRETAKVVSVESSTGMQELGIRLAAVLEPGDLIIATGDLGAGKTTLAQGIGLGLGVDSPVISPTFVLSRVHHSATGRPTFVHVDAYRLAGELELDDIDLDESLDESVTLIEWGAGVAEGLNHNRLEIDIQHDGDGRIVTLTPVGPRWQGVLREAI